MNSLYNYKNVKVYVYILCVWFVCVHLYIFISVRVSVWNFMNTCIYLCVNKQTNKLHIFTHIYVCNCLCISNYRQCM